AGAGKEISLLIVGDSLTNATYYPREVYNLMQGENNPILTMAGSHAGGGKKPSDGVAHEGYGGWRWSTFCTRWGDDDPYRGKSKFLREIDGEPTLDFQHYLDTYNDGEAPDFVTVLLGCNDTFSATEEDIEERIDEMFGWADTLLAEFQRVAPDTQIGIHCLCHFRPARMLSGAITNADRPAGSTGEISTAWWSGSLRSSATVRMTTFSSCPRTSTSTASTATPRAKSRSTPGMTR
ncbi:MAG: hypothetical protein ACLFWB_13040, partial [Armatimonadota bacterium]